MRENLQRSANFSHRRTRTEYIAKEARMLSTTDFIVRIGTTLRSIFNKTFAVSSETTVCYGFKNTGASTGGTSTEMVGAMKRNREALVISSRGYRNAMSNVNSDETTGTSSVTTTRFDRKNAGTSRGCVSTEEDGAVNQNRERTYIHLRGYHNAAITTYAPFGFALIKNLRAQSEAVCEAVSSKSTAVPSGTTVNSDRKNAGTSRECVSTEEDGAVNQNRERTYIHLRGYRNAAITTYAPFGFALTTNLSAQSEAVCEAVLSKSTAAPSGTVDSDRKNAGTSRGCVSTEEDGAANQNRERTFIPSETYHNAAITTYAPFGFALTTNLRAQSEAVCEASSTTTRNIPLPATIVPNCKNAAMSTEIISSNPSKVASSEGTQPSARVDGIDRGLFFITACREARA